MSLRINQPRHHQQRRGLGRHQPAVSWTSSPLQSTVPLWPMSPPAMTRPGSMFSPDKKRATAAIGARVEVVTGDTPQPMDSAGGKRLQWRPPEPFGLGSPKRPPFEFTGPMVKSQSMRMCPPASTSKSAKNRILAPKPSAQWTWSHCASIESGW